MFAEKLTRFWGEGFGHVPRRYSTAHLPADRPRLSFQFRFHSSRFIFLLSPLSRPSPTFIRSVRPLYGVDHASDDRPADASGKVETSILPPSGRRGVPRTANKSSHGSQEMDGLKDLSSCARCKQHIFLRVKVSSVRRLRVGRLQKNVGFVYAKERRK